MIYVVALAYEGDCASPQHELNKIIGVKTLLVDAQQMIWDKVPDYASDFELVGFSIYEYEPDNLDGWYDNQWFFDTTGTFRRRHNYRLDRRD